MRTGIIVLVALALGGLAGAAGVHLMRQGQLASLQTELSSAQDAATGAEERAKNAAAELASLQRRAETLERQVAGLSEQLEAVETAKPMDMAALMPEGDTALAALPAREFAPGPAPLEGERPEQRIENESAGAEAEPSEEEAAQQAEREARRAEWRARIEDRLNTFYDEAYMGAKDRQEQDRLALMKEYTDYAMDLWAQARQAETDEERQALREAGGEAMRTLNDLRREQQADMVRDVAAQHGITDPKQQDALAQSVIRLQESPFFQPGRIFGGGGPGRPGGGRGGR